MELHISSQSYEEILEIPFCPPPHAGAHVQKWAQTRPEKHSLEPILVLRLFPTGKLAWKEKINGLRDISALDIGLNASETGETAGNLLEILVSSSQGGAGTLEKGHRGAIFPGKLPETENLKGGHISRRISGNVCLSQVPRPVFSFQ